MSFRKLFKKYGASTVLVGTRCPVVGVGMDASETSGNIESIGIVATSAGWDEYMLRRTQSVKNKHYGIYITT